MKLTETLKKLGLFFTKEEIITAVMVMSHDDFNTHVNSNDELILKEAARISFAESESDK